ncbi:MAG TPA: T9SS type A sorting domain-containing protein [Bacteroidia bacterium]|nr:T9SS type A sorting domain-containing protein [Bacteroidia bacterium]
MKKLTLILACIFASITAPAQYGQRTYYFDTTTTETFNKGIISTINMYNGLPVYAGTGTVNVYPANVTTHARFVRAANNGTILNNRRYNMYKNNTLVATRSNGIDDATNKFVMAGAVYGGTVAQIPGLSDVMIMKTTVNGVPTTPRHVDIGGGYDEALCVKNSTYNTQNFYTCGYSILQGVSRAFVMKHDATGSVINWVKYFSIPCTAGQTNTRANYVIDDPATGNVCVVGTIDSSATGGCRQSFIMKMTRAGVFLWLHLYVYPNGTGIDFNSIKPTELANEYIIAGTVGLPAPLNDRVLLFRVNTAGNVPNQVFANIMYTNGPTPNYPIQKQKGLDATQRINGTAVTYFVCGETQYAFGTTDGIIFKTNGNGVPTAARLYGSTSNDRLNAIDQLNTSGASGAGLASFGKSGYTGTAGTSAKDRSWLVKSYFNLVSGCNEIYDSTHSVAVTLSHTALQPTLLTAYIADTLSAQMVACKQSVLCWATTVAGGSNLRSASDESLIDLPGFNVYPNPLAVDEVTIELFSETSSVAMLNIIDATGRIVHESQVQLSEGSNRIKADMSRNSKGWYVLQLVTNEGSYMSKLLKE